MSNAGNNMVSSPVPYSFVWKKIHSLTGVLLALFLFEHLLVNSQAALLIGESGQGFIDLANAIHRIPYLQVVEMVFIGVPMLVHAMWGIKYGFQSQLNSLPTDGIRPFIPTGRNRAFSWQRITAWIIFAGVILHVAKMRFIDYPDLLKQGKKEYYFTPLSFDEGLYTVANRLKVKLYGLEEIFKERERLGQIKSKTAPSIEKMDEKKRFNLTQEEAAADVQTEELQQKKMVLLEKQKIDRSQVVAVCNDFGTVALLKVRDTFKSPLNALLYTIFVLASAFHAFNGIWSFCISWGLILKYSAQKYLVRLSFSMMTLIAFLGLISIWGTYWLNLKK